MSDIRSWRNELYAKTCNWLALWLPTNEYVAQLAAIHKYGMDSIVRDEKEGREAPTDWRESQ